MTDAEKLILALARDGSLPDDDFYELIRMRGSLNKEERDLLKNEARRKADAVYGGITGRSSDTASRKRRSSTVRTAAMR